MCLIISYSEWPEPLLPLLFNFPLGYAIRKGLENQVGRKLDGKNLLLVYWEIM
jgi:hypothetical protein